MELTLKSIKGYNHTLRVEPIYAEFYNNPVTNIYRSIIAKKYISNSVSLKAAGAGMKSRSINFNELDHFVNLQDHSSTDTPDSLEIKVNIDEITPKMHLDFEALHVHADGKDDVDFNYVRDVLKKSGFSGDELLGTWHSPNQPVDPSLFDEVECSPHKLDIPGPEAGSSSDHQLLFNLINEVLLEIYERSFTCCPWRLCFNSSTRPMPVGDHVLEEVWASINWHLSSQPQLHPSLEYVVARDLAKNDGWMHLQEEAESLGLEFEEWILDDLLDEVTFELAGTCKD